MPDVGTFTAHPALKDLPTYVRKQRTLEAKILPLQVFVGQEKDVRGIIDMMLIDAGIQKGESVTCNGYDIAHVERVGTSRLNQDILTEQLVATGLRREWVTKTLADCTEMGEPSHWATVKPSKGAKVRK